MIVCSLMTISVVSGRGLLTREAMAVASVSTIILRNATRVSLTTEREEKHQPIIYRFVQTQQYQVQVLQHPSLLQRIAEKHGERVGEGG